MELTEDVLLRRMMAGDEEAFTALYRRRQGAVYRFALHMSGNTAVAEDVVQEAFMTLIRDPRRFEPKRGTLGGFLVGIARNHLRRRWEQEQKLKPLPDDFEARIAEISRNDDGHGNGIGNGDRTGHSPSDEFAAAETAGRVRRAIATLPENYREAVILCELEEMSYEDAASALDCPVGTVRSRLHRARALLMEKLREERPVQRVRTAAGE